MVEKLKLKTIKIKPETHIKLASLGKKGDSFDDLIHMLIESYNKKHK